MSVHKEHAGDFQEKITYSWGVNPTTPSLKYELPAKLSKNTVLILEWNTEYQIL